MMNVQTAVSTEPRRATGSQPDPVTLSWCAAEIRASLGQCAQRLREALGASATDRAAEPAALQAVALAGGPPELEAAPAALVDVDPFAYGAETARLLQASRRALRAAHGALRMMAIDGVTLLTQEIDTLLERFERGAAPLENKPVETIARATDALSEYLDEVAAGGAHQPLRLYPYYRALLESRRAERVHPADLFFPDLRIDTPDGPSPATRLRTDARLAARGRFEGGLLRFLRKADDAAALADMCAAVDTLEASQRDTAQRAFWWLALAFFDALRTGAITADLYAKRLIARLNTQMKHTLDQGASAPDRLLVDTLFELARARHPQGLAAQAIERFGLADVVPDDFEMPRYANVDAGALREARDATVQAKQAWDRATRGSRADATAFGDACAALAQACGRLPAPGLQRVTAVLARIRGVVDAAGQRIPEAASLEIATALMFVEQVLERGARADDPYHSHGSEIAERLSAAFAGRPVPEALPAWMVQLAAGAQHRQTMSALVSELQIGLRGAEKTLDAFFRAADQRGALAGLELPLRQVAGALRMIDHADAADGARATAVLVTRMAAETDAPSDEACERVAGNFGALGFYVDGLLQPDQLAGRFEFDAAAERFGLVPEKVRDVLPEVADESVESDEPAIDLSRFDLSMVESPAAAGAPSEAGQAEPAAMFEDFAFDAPADGFTLPDPEALASPAIDFESIALPALDRGAFEPIALEPIALDPIEPDAFDVEPIEFAVPDFEPLDVEPPRSEPFTGDALALDPLAIEPVESADPPAEPVEAVATMDTLEPAAASSVPAAAPSVPAAAPIDLELLEIFLGEADEVLASVDDCIGRLRASPSDAEALATLRRDFHTLKGSSRMVGLTAFGEAGWAMEQVMDAWLAEARAASPALHALIEQARGAMVEWVGALQRDAGFPVAAEALIAAAARLMQAGSDTPEAAIEPSPAVEAVEAVEAAASVEPAEPMRAAESAAPDRPQARAISPSLYVVFLGEAHELVGQLAAEAIAWRDQPGHRPAERALRAAHSLTGSSSLVGLHDVHELAAALEGFLRAHAVTGAPLQPDATATFARAVEQMREMLHRFAAGKPRQDDPRTVAQLVALGDRIAPSCGVDLPDHEIAGFDEEPVEASPAQAGCDLPGTQARADVVRDDVEPVAAQAEAAAPLAAVESIEASAVPSRGPNAQAVASAEAGPAAGAVPQRAVEGAAPVELHDELDAELLPVFLVEADEYLPAVGDRLRAWAASPADMALPAALMRDLHTIKGSARMAGAMRLGQIVHEMESRIEDASRLQAVPAELIDALIVDHDQVLALYDTLKAPDAPSAAQRAAPEAVDRAPPAVPQARAQAASEVAPTAPVVPAAPAAAQPGQALIRVRAELLDRMVNEAGEVAIARARLDNEIGTIRQGLIDLTENVARLRSQLREIEIQAESQIQARSAQAREAHGEFDPLEFDRFTRFQELTRMLAESVNDVGTVQQNMVRALEDATVDLSRQAQVSRDLQQNLMRVRMVQFGTIADRLYRVVRRASKDMDRRVNLDLRGAAAEIDRGILERMVGPIEHLLRNSVAHGIEPRERRLAAGKPEAGEIVVEVRQERNEAVLTFSDDGAGLDIAAIRARALQNGLLRPGQAMSDAEVAELIFVPGFSTVEAITATAGRGVGMDVVRAEVAALGGRIVTDTQAGRGTRFTIHLPLTLAVTQVLLLTVAERRYAVPAVMVEQVLQMKPVELAAAYRERAIDWQGARLPLFHLGGLLDLPEQAPLAQRQVPVLVLHSGNQRIALHVDHISANQEVVVKNAGPQLARLKGVAGATVLGNGDIALIVNPVQLAQTPGSAIDALDLSRSGLRAGALPAAAQAAPTVMVVDDSLTVRKATQRLLAREHYQVMLAKDGVDALRQLQETVPDVMLVDIEMPRMDGFDLTRNVRADARLRDVPIVMITSRTADKHRNKAMALGVDVYLGKPYAEDELLAHVAGFVARR